MANTLRYNNTIPGNIYYGGAAVQNVYYNNTKVWSASRPFSFTYTGAYETEGNLEGNFVIRFKTSGTLTITNHGNTNGLYDVFLVGGGAGGTDTKHPQFNSAVNSCGGGGGGYTKINKRISLSSSIYVTVGSGGAANTNGGNSSISDISVSGGNIGIRNRYNTSIMDNYYTCILGGNGGSGGGTGCNETYNYGATQDSCNGGSNGNNGYGAYSKTSGLNSIPGGSGQGTTTREFGESTGKLYAGGGGGAYVYMMNESGMSSNLNTGIGVDGGGNGLFYSYLYSPNTNRIATSALANTGSGGGGGSTIYYNMSQDGLTNGNAGSGGSGIVCLRNAR